MNKSSKIALATIILASLWVLSGVFKSKKHHEEDLEKDTQKIPVKVKKLTASLKTNTLILRGTTEPYHTANLKAETAGRIIWVSDQKGKFVKAATVLAKIDPDARTANLMQAKALFDQRTVDFNAATTLLKKKFISESKFLEAKAARDAAEANLKQAQIELSRTEIKAPFDGIVQDNTIDIGDYVNANNPSSSPIISIVNLDPLKTVLHVTENELPKLKESIEASIKRSDGQVLKGTISYIAKAADVQSKTFTVEILSENPTFLSAGMSAEVSIPYATTPAHLISPALLSLDTNGVVGAKYVDDAHVVHFAPITILETSPEGVWVKGLPEKVTLITVGGEFVQEGLKVISQDEDAHKPAEKNS